MDKQIAKLLEALVEFVEDQEARWGEKKQRILAQADERERNALVEFVAWFDEQDIQDDGVLRDRDA